MLLFGVAPPQLSMNKLCRWFMCCAPLQRDSMGLTQHELMAKEVCFFLAVTVEQGASMQVFSDQGNQTTTDRGGVHGMRKNVWAFLFWEMSPN